jgi:hypothetical protein
MERPARDGAVGHRVIAFEQLRPRSASAGGTSTTRGPDGG